MKKLNYICSFALLLALFNLPIVYYTFLRIIVFIGALLNIKNETKNDVNLLGIFFIIIAILFNPIYPIYLYQKSIWMPIDILTALYFVLYKFKK